MPAALCAPYHHQMRCLVHLIDQFLSSLLSVWLAGVVMTLLPTTLHAQLYPITAQIAPTQTALTPYIHEWVNPAAMLGPLQATLLFNDLNNPPITASVRISIEGNGTSVRSNPNTPTIVNLTPGHMLTLDQNTLASLLSPAKLSNHQQGALGNALPEGLYTICIEVYDIARQVPISNRACNVFSVQHFDVPEWRMLQPITELPSDAFTIGRTDASLASALTFSWTARHPPLLMAEYALQIYAMPKDPSLTYEQVLRSELPVFSTTTFATQYVYTPMDPPLDTNRTYLAQLNVRDPMEQYNFVNHGIGPIATFQIIADDDDHDESEVDPCLDPANRPILTLDHHTPDTAYLSWELPATLYFDSVFLDRQGASGWMPDTALTVEINAHALDLSTAEPQRFRLGVYCTTADTLIYSQPVSTSPFPQMAPDGCDPNLVIHPIDRTPLDVPLQIGDSVILGDFLMVIDQITPGGRNGEGYVVTPLFNMFRPRLAVTFENLAVNQEYRMLSGMVLTVTDPNEAAMLNVGDLSAIFKSQSGFDDLIYDKYTVEDKIIGIDISADGSTTITIVDAQGNVSTASYPFSTSPPPDYAEILLRDGYLLVGDAFVESKTATPSSWTDSTGTVYGRVGNSVYHASDRLDQGLASIMGTLGTVSFQPNPEAPGGLDIPFDQANVGDYPSIGDSYQMPWKAIRVGTSEPVYVDISGAQADTIFFETVSGYALDYDQASPIHLEVPCRGEGSQETVYAIGQSIRGMDTLLTTLGAMKVAGYPLRLMTLNIIPLNDAVIPVQGEQLAADLNRIYNPAIVSWQVKILDALTIDDLPVPLVAGKGATHQYNRELRRIGQLLKDHDLIHKGTKESPILTIVVLPQLSGDYHGYMPLRRNLGFVDGGKDYAPADQGIHGFSRVVAHELGHGAFGLEHSWNLYPKMPERSSHNLMDYSSGVQLTKAQWDQIHNPLPVLGFLETTKGAAGQGEEKILVNEAFIYSNYVYFAQDQPDQAFAGITPSGQKFIIPGDAIAAFFPEKEGPWPQGCLAGFRINNTRYFGWWNKSDRQFAGYAEGVSTDQGQLLKYGEYLPTLPDAEVAVYAGKIAADCEHQIWWQPKANAWTVFEQPDQIANIDLQSFIMLESAQVPQSPCGCFQGECQELLQTYRSHPYLQDDNVLRRALCANPCILKDLEHQPFFVYPTSEWMENLNNICALMVAFGLTPAALTAVTISAESILLRIVQSIASQSAEQLILRFSIGSASDILVQRAIYYYFPAEGQATSWEDTRDKVDLTSAIASGFESILVLNSKYEEAAVSAAISCFVDGNLTEGTVSEEFSVEACGTGLLSALAIHGILSVSSSGLRYLRALPPRQVIRGFIRFFDQTPPGVVTAGAHPDGALLWRALRQIFPDPLTNQHLKALLDIEDDRVTTLLADALDHDPTLTTDLFESGFFLRIRNLDLPSNVRATLVEDISGNKRFRDAIMGDERLVKAWESVAHLPVELRLDTWYLTQVDDYLGRMNKTGDVLRRELEEFNGTAREFLDALEDTPASGTYASNPDGVWNLGPLGRGREIEKVEGQNLHDNFPIIDRFDPETKEAVSIKSTDIFARSYQSMDWLETVWKGYIDDLLEMPSPDIGLQYAGDVVIGYEKQVLKIAIPDVINSNQERVLAAVRTYGKGKGVNGTDVEVIISIIQ